jgi:hypothetical protein
LGYKELLRRGTLYSHYGRAEWMGGSSGLCPAEVGEVVGGTKVGFEAAESVIGAPVVEAEGTEEDCTLLGTEEWACHNTPRHKAKNACSVKS